MNNIFLGFLLCFIQLNISFGELKIMLLPDFIGYIFILRGAVKLLEESDYFIKVKSYIQILITYSLIRYGMEVFGLNDLLSGFFSVGISVVFAVIELAMIYDMIKGVADIEEKYHGYLDSESLYSIWKVDVILTLATYVVIIIQKIAQIVPIIVIVLAIITFGINIYFLIILNQTRKQYSKLKEAKE